ncbi:hypothetical protein JZ751_003717 [Albula glossodonta]|uniref:WD repeat-containing protein 97 n=1 Tax=Albula glossodonta TaxID=121402 RepID=A0A8T2P5A0_9TELE|nr:hypothetical protein JZ751_003717 [Albula glossodonta]
MEFLSLHAGGRVSSYHPDGQLGATFGRHAEFTGLTGTRLPGRIAGWGPGATLALLDNELRPLAHALDPLDIRVCQAAELTPELVTAGEGNVCVWCLAHLVCKSSLIVSASLDGTLRCWSLEEGDQVQVVSAEGGGAPPLALVGPGKGGTFFSYSKRGVDFWSMASLYSLHCKLGDARGVTGVRTMQQIVVPAYPPPYPARAVCVTGDRKLAVVAAETGAILTTFSLGAGQKVKSVDYCLPKETLLVLTEDGAVLRASTLTNPATGLDEWQGRWEEPWPKAKQTEEEGENRTHTGPGLALCMTLYSALNDHREALEDWREIQELCDPRAVKRRSLHNGKNRFLVMLGQEGGCVSVLRWNSGEVLCRSPAHSGQSITALLADPENSYLFSSGEDKMVLVWRVCPFTADCLSLHLSLLCGQPPVHLASLGSLLALAIQEPDSATYSLIGVLVSSSQDGTIRIWDDENRLLRYMTSVEEEEYQLEKNMAYATLVARSKDLESLQQGVVGSKKKRAHTTRQTKKEAFGRYLKLIPEKDVVGQQVALFSLRQPTDLRSLRAVTVREQARLLERGAEAGQGKGSSCDHRTSWGHIPNSVLLGQLWPDMVPEDSLPLIPWTLREGLGQLSDVRVPKRPLVVRFREPECPPPPTPKPPTPPKPQTAPEHSPPPSSPPCQCSLPHTPPRQNLPPHSPPHQAPRTPTPPCQLPEFLSQFVDQDWFHEVCPDQSLLRESLSREEFAMLLLERLRCRHATPRLQILRALLLLLRQGALGNSEQISASLIDLLQLSATSSMSEEERRFVCELLKVLASLRPVSTGTVAELLTALAHRELGLQRVVIRLLKTMGVEEAEPWLSSCVASWQDGLQGRPDTWAHLRQVAAHWLDFWTSKYKDRALLFKGEEKKDPASPVDVLRFFCSVQRENQSRLPPPPPVGRRDTVLLPQHSDRPKPIQRLGETHSLARTRQTKGVTLPPLPHRPLLVGFVPFISLPLPRVTAVAEQVRGQEQIRSSPLLQHLLQLGLRGLMHLQLLSQGPVQQLGTGGQWGQARLVFL